MRFFLAFTVSYALTSALQARPIPVRGVDPRPAPILDPDFPRMPSTHPITLPSMTAPATVATCGDKNIITEPPEDAVDGTNPDLTITILFKDLVLSKNASGDVSLACTLYSKVPTSFAESGRVIKVVSTVYQIKSQMTDSTDVKGTASLGFGVVSAGSLRFPTNSHLAAGTIPGMSNPGTTSAGTLMGKANSASSDSMRIVRKTDDDGSLIRERNTTIGASSLSPGETTQNISIDVTNENGTAVEDGGYIVNPFRLTLTGVPPRLDTKVELTKIEITIQALD